jgi:lipoprotein-anchoring transpeptidase ErfK/SrfK
LVRKVSVACQNPGEFEMKRREFISFAVGSVLALGLSMKTERALAASKKTKPFVVDKKYMPQRVLYNSKYKRGTIVVDTQKRFLYLVESPISARRYGVGVGREALAWSGTATIDVKKEWPSWRPTDEMIEREPGKYAKYKDGMPGGPTNPLGARALYLFDKGYDTFYRIHGTTAPQSIGTAASNGCIRMVNEHVIDLYNRVPIGTQVVVL